MDENRSYCICPPVKSQSGSLSTVFATLVKRPHAVKCHVGQRHLAIKSPLPISGNLQQDSYKRMKYE